MKQLYQYNNQSKALDLLSSRDRKLWGEIYLLIGHNTSLADRTGFIKMPYNMAVLPEVKMPYGQSKTLRECTDLRVAELLAAQNNLNVPLCIYYSGGIDSTYTLASILKRISPQEAAERLVIAMTPDSVFENPVMYEKFIRGKLKVIPSDEFASCLSMNMIAVSGELGDQLFGSDIMLTANSIIGPTAAFTEHCAENAFKIFTKSRMSFASAELWTLLIGSSAQAFGFEVKTLYDLLWWYNFSCKWQGIFLRMMACSSVPLRANARQALAAGYYQNFFSSDQFQLWSFNNHHLGMKFKTEIGWPGYKYILKEEIYDLLKDANYRDNKLKIGSLWKRGRNKFHAVGIDSELNFINMGESLDPFYQPKNSFS